MTKIIKKTMHCPECDKDFEVPVVLSTNSFMLKKDPKLMKKYNEGTLFKNFCPVCNCELKNKEEK